MTTNILTTSSQPLYKLDDKVQQIYSLLTSQGNLEKRMDLLDSILGSVNVEDVNSAYIALSRVHNADEPLLDYFQQIAKQNDYKYREALGLDTKTGAYNFRFFMQRLNQEINSFERNQKAHPNEPEKVKSFCLAYIDLDHFKDFNDKYDHIVGDAVVIEVVEDIKKALRIMDDVFRVGGDELAIILDDIDKEKGLEIAGRTLYHIVNDFNYAKTGYTKEQILETIGHGIQASIGIAVYGEDAHNIEDILRKADRAMIYAKHTGKIGYWHNGERSLYTHTSDKMLVEELCAA